jgi:importin subunit beta-1
MLAMLDVDPVAELLTQGRRSKTTKTKTLSQWATKEIRKLKNASSSW